MTTPGIKGLCAERCGLSAQLNHYKNGVMTPLCFECFWNGYNELLRLNRVQTVVKEANICLDETLPFETDDEWPEETQPFQEVRVRCVHGALFGDSCERCDAVLNRII